MQAIAFGNSIIYYYSNFSAFAMASTTLSLGLRSILFFCLFLIGLGACRKNDDNVSPATGGGPTINLVAVNGVATVGIKSQTVTFMRSDTVKLRFAKSGNRLRFSTTRAGSTNRLFVATTNQDTLIKYKPFDIQDGEVITYRVKDSTGRADSVLVTFRQVADPTSLGILSVNGRTDLNGKNLVLEYGGGDTLSVKVRRSGAGLLVQRAYPADRVGYGARLSSLDGDTTYKILTAGVPDGTVWRLRITGQDGNRDSVEVRLSETQFRFDNLRLELPTSILNPNDSKSFLRLTTGIVSTLGEASSDPATIDLGFSSDLQLYGLLLSPDNWLDDSYGLGYEINRWAARRQTEFRIANGTKLMDYLTRADLEAAFNAGNNGTSTVNAQVLTGANNTGPSSRANSRVAFLQRGDVIVFKTQGGKYGIIRVNSCVLGPGTTGNNGLFISYKIGI